MLIICEAFDCPLNKAKLCTADTLIMKLLSIEPNGEFPEQLPYCEEYRKNGPKGD